jgi:benzoyl-CoA reductase/2-hydroxyglutaryl-CoA dehydratase subunit BcrC/BadD/HgdB
MEKELQRLLETSEESNRWKPAAQWKKEGKKVVGLLCSYIPEEVIHAAGMLPVRIMGGRQPNTPHADLYRPPHTCLYCTHVLESLFDGEFEFLDAVVATSWDQDLIRLWDVWKYLGKTPAAYILHLPLSDSATSRKQYAKEVKKFSAFIEDLAETSISAEGLSRSIEMSDKVRGYLHQLYDLRKRPAPPLSGAEMLRLTTAAMLMPTEEFMTRVESLLPYLETRQCGVPTRHPRILVSSDRLDDPGYLDLVEESGCLVAMDDLDTGARWFWEHTDAARAGSLEEMLAALAFRSHAQPASPCIMNWADQVEQVASWVKAFDIHGVLELPLMYSRSRQMRAPYLKNKLTALGIPVASFEREYQLANVGQLRTRVGAFVEMLQ